MSGSTKSSPEGRLWGVILAGGIGSRFWPASTPKRPKQLLHLASDQPLISETVDRVEPLIPTERLRILTGAHLAGPIGGALPAFGEANFFLEPRAAGTAPALVWAAALIERIDPDAVMVSLHADHVIDPPATFRAQLLRAAELAEEHGRLFTLGAVPDRPETGYGYIRRGPPLPSAAASPETGYEVERFVEKPDTKTAAEYLASGEYLWNTGIFIWRVRDLLDQIERHTPEIAGLIPRLRRGDTAGFFERVPTLSIDEGLLERSDRVGVLPTRFRWDDIGAWDALYRTHALDDRGNAVIGEGFAVESNGCVLYADGGPIVAFGVEDLVIVRTGGVTFVTHRERAAELKALHAHLPEKLKKLE
ncbi:MAG TPA: sugar phosphate nucleotidyltransferase [Longimicrobiaceae bacterium]|nr:sugar phosphate nucleotidyltransferase [Longimicrobiaceae bacterium]